MIIYLNNAKKSPSIINFFLNFDSNKFIYNWKNFLLFEYYHFFGYINYIQIPNIAINKPLKNNNSKLAIISSNGNFAKLKKNL